MQSEHLKQLGLIPKQRQKQVCIWRILARAVTWSEDRHETPDAAVKGSKLGAAERPRDSVPPPPRKLLRVSSQLNQSWRGPTEIAVARNSLFSADRRWLVVQLGFLSTVKGSNQCQANWTTVFWFSLALLPSNNRQAKVNSSKFHHLLEAKLSN